MASFFENLVNIGMTALFAATAALRLYQAYREATDEASGGRSDGVVFRRTWTFGGRDDDDLLGGDELDDSTPRQVLLTTPSGERMVVLASVDALREMGILPEGASPPSSAAAAARRRVAAAAASGRELGADDYESLLALDDGPPRGGGGPVTRELLEALPCAPHKPKVKRTTKRAPSFSSASPSVLAGIAAARRRGDRVDEDEKEGGAEGEEQGAQEEEEVCSVCLQPFKEGELVRTLPCLHRFHAGECIDAWLVQQGRGAASCPVCKTAVFR